MGTRGRTGWRSNSKGPRLFRRTWALVHIRIQRRPYAVGVINRSLAIAAAGVLTAATRLVAALVHVVGLVSLLALLAATTLLRGVLLAGATLLGGILVAVRTAAGTLSLL